jgi:hypothetical protein
VIHRTFRLMLGTLFSIAILAGCAKPTEVAMLPTLTNTQAPPTKTQPPPTVTLLPTTTPAPLPLSQRDLSLIGIHAADLPGEFSEVLSTTSLDDISSIYNDNGIVMANLNNGFLGFFNTSDELRSVLSAIFVYDNEGLAADHFSSLSSPMYGDTLIEAPVIGKESAAVVGTYTDSSGDLSCTTQLTWRYTEAVAYVYMSGDQQPTSSELVRLAQLVQARMEGPGVAKPPSPTDTQAPPTKTQPPLSYINTPIPPTSGPVEIGMSRSYPYPFRELVTAPNWDIQVLEVLRGDAAWQLRPTDKYNEPAPAGMEYLLVKIHVKCTFDDQEEHMIYYGSDFKVTGDRLTLYSFAGGMAPEPVLEATLYKGEETEGWAAYLVGQGEGDLMLALEEFTEYYEYRLRFMALEEGASISVSPELSSIQPNDLGMKRSSPAPFGETVITEDWKASFLEVMRGDAAWTMIYKANPYTEPPDKGMEYIAVRMYVQYIGTVDEVDDFWGDHFSTIGSANVVYDFPNTLEPEPAMTVNLFPGGEAEGWLILQVAKGETNISAIFNPFLNESQRYMSLEP